MVDVSRQAVTGLVPPQQGEALIREAWPSLASVPSAAGLGRVLIRSIALAPVGWLALGLPFVLRISPFLARRYTLTNRRLFVRHGWKGTAGQSVNLADIEDVRVRADVNSEFYRAGTLEVVANGQVALALPGVPEPHSFRHAILNACMAWAPGKVKGAFIPASATK